MPQDAPTIAVVGPKGYSVSKARRGRRLAERTQTSPRIRALLRARSARVSRRLGWSATDMLRLAAGWAFTAFPVVVELALVAGLILGGCCTNVFALEAIIKPEPQAGFLITFVQFLFVALVEFRSQYSPGGKGFLKPTQVPLGRWARYTIIYWLVSVLNNWAFNFRISVPVHIILRSGGSITTMLVGKVWGGKKYSRGQIVAVALLTVGVVVAAMADAINKGKTSTPQQPLSKFLAGLAILLISQLLSAFMGLYSDQTYARYGKCWRESLFYSHLLALPLFAPFLPTMLTHLSPLASSPPILSYLSSSLSSSSTTTTTTTTTMKATPALTLYNSLASSSPPILLVALVANALTQYICLAGVNMVASSSSALTVTIVLNIRKLVSLLLSLWIFGHRLSAGVLSGAALVFVAAGMYAWEGQRLRSRSRSKSKRAEVEMRDEKGDDGEGRRARLVRLGVDVDVDVDVGVGENGRERVVVVGGGDTRAKTNGGGAGSVKKRRRRPKGGNTTTTTTTKGATS